MKKSIKIFVIILIFSLPSVAYASDGGKGYIYDGASVGDQRAIVFNNALAEVSIQNKSSADINASSHGFGGTFRDCSNKRYHCISGPINVAIPKDISNFKSSWKYNGIVCKKRPGGQRGLYTVTCKSGFNGVESVVEFSVLRGILSFKNTPIGGASLFKSRGCEGIFYEAPKKEKGHHFAVKGPKGTEAIKVRSPGSVSRSSHSPIGDLSGRRVKSSFVAFSTVAEGE